MDGSRGSQETRADIVLEIVEGPMDGSVFVTEREAISLGRNPENDITLAGDPLVSGSHARLQRTSDPRAWDLLDQNSSNGTWVRGEPLAAPYRLSVGDHFLVGGQSVVRLRAWEEGDETFLLSAADLNKERQRILSRLPSSLNSAIGAASMLAAREMRDSLNERYLFLGIAMTEADFPIFERGKGLIGDEILRDFLWEERFWVDLPWVEERVRQVRIEQFFAYRCTWTPRLIRLLQKAEAASKRRGRPRTETIDVLRVLIGDGSSRVHRWLTQHGISVERVFEIFDSVPMSQDQDPTVTSHDSTQWASAGDEAIARPDPARSAAGPPPVPGPAPAEPPPAARSRSKQVMTTGDRHLDQRAQEAGGQLYSVAALYQLATPEDRTESMRRLLEKHLAEVPDEKRRAWLEQVRRLFPIDPSTDSKARELEELHRLVAELRARVKELETRSGSGGALPWQLVLGKTATGELDSLSPSDRPRVELLREIFQFGIRQERFLIQMVQDLTVKFTNNTTVSLLPGHSTTIQSFIHDLHQGRQVRLEDLRFYLADLERWLIAGIMAFNAGPEEWYKEFWQQNNPRAFEARATGGIVGNLGIWRSYKEEAKNWRPDIASQHIRRKTQEIAKRKHRDLVGKRSTNA